MKMKRQLGLPTLAGPLLLVLVYAPGFAGATSLRRHFNGVASSFHQPEGGFEDLATCEVAYNNLELKCGHSSYAPAPSGVAPCPPSGKAKDRQDEESATYHDGQGIVQTEDPVAEPEQYAMPRDKSGTWDYMTHGDDWASLGSCRGSHQSPIDLSRYLDVQGQTKYVLWFDYYKDPDIPDKKIASLVNNGHKLMFSADDNEVDLGFVKIGLQEFTATEYEFHAPSEHSMDGAVYPLEVQIINKGDDGKMVAIAVFFREGPSNPFLSGIMQSMYGMGPEWSVRKGTGWSPINGTFHGAFNLESIIPKGTDGTKEKVFFNYQGSLTSPPCTEGVDWWVLSDPITASRDEIRFIRKAIFNTPSMKHGNSRSTQELGHRSVFVGITGFQHAVKARIKKWMKHDAVQQPRGYTSNDMPWGPHWDAMEEEPELSSAPSPAGSPAGAPAPALAFSPA